MKWKSKLWIVLVGFSVDLIFLGLDSSHNVVESISDVVVLSMG